MKAALLVQHLVGGNRKLGVILYLGPEGKEKMNGKDKEFKEKWEAVRS